MLVSLVSLYLSQYSIYCQCSQCMLYSVLVLCVYHSSTVYVCVFFFYFSTPPLVHSFSEAWVMRKKVLSPSQTPF